MNINQLTKGKTLVQIMDMILEELDDQNKFNLVHHDFDTQVARFRLSSESDEIVGNEINILIYTLCSFYSKQRLYRFRKHINVIRIDSIFPNSNSILKSRIKG